ncbi:NAD(P)-dependent oxidoreductase [Frankia sp. CNm7]|uniref:NAD(P)-dependent oxidoreductase n=1 Tax=Frankia nepalensis TaxID=1836974 RepID=A0A937RJB7_9ACTN|nr:NAD(P)-dependent oxidoreductase [Frankia nepalensis]MBL7500952.1 NAD(P)-dependent oxidoreductase [Frankia nepalensis]MBL7510073.1 NAD(P)-dependent oxidoreductase [Frankia nepalensis]MBL7521734.1 NAD(P)-dependent oxidoreductase [Frankia nepalensis]MBL7633321.1 NAD(P)-dependent oxidoreductase [Frankia nepalensis]
MAETAPVVGFVGLGNMGAALAGNLVAHGFEVVVFDVAGPDRAPYGSRFAADVAELARSADIVVFSLPDGNVSEKVATDVVNAAGRVTHIIDTSTIGVTAARRITELLAAAGIGYVDAPVSGGVAGARARRLAVMYAGTDDAVEAVELVLAGLSDRIRRVGDRPGLGQALKLANNFLSATALAATSEAVAFGVRAGLDMGTMIEVLNGSSGRSAATEDKFVNDVLTGRYGSGFANTLMAKDVRLYLAEVRDAATPDTVGAVTEEIWQRFAAAEPNADFTRIYPFVEGSA